MIVEKIKPEHRQHELNNIKNIIYTICINLPCPVCKSHAVNYLNKNYGKVNSMDELKIYLYNFHNVVNIQTKKTQQHISILDVYKKLDFNIIVKTWNKYFKLFYVDQFTFKEETQREKSKQLVLNYLKTNQHKFI
jgi:hypothetical protein